MDMDLSSALREFKPGVIMMYPKYFLGIVFKKIRYSGLEIFLDYDGIVIYRPHLSIKLLREMGGSPLIFLLAFNSFSTSFQWYSAQDKVTN
jgi:hypothetical protein